jgi:hypothetical protein
MPRGHPANVRLQQVHHILEAHIVTADTRVMCRVMQKHCAMSRTCRSQGQYINPDHEVEKEGLPKSGQAISQIQRSKQGRTTLISQQQLHTRPNYIYRQ